MRRALIIATTSLALGCGTSSNGGGSGGTDAGSSGNGGRDASIFDDILFIPDVNLVDLACEDTFDGNEACGGNPVGRWTYEAVCGESSGVDLLERSCPGSNVISEMRSATVDLLIEANGRYRQDITDTATLVMDFPRTCVFGAPCSAVETLIRQDVKSVSCTAMGNSCRCDIATEIETDEMGTYTINGGSIATNPDNSPIDGDYWFCVDRTALRYRAKAESTVFVLTSN